MAASYPEYLRALLEDAYGRLDATSLRTHPSTHLDTCRMLLLSTQGHCTRRGRRSMRRAARQAGRCIANELMMASLREVEPRAVDHELTQIRRTLMRDVAYSCWLRGRCARAFHRRARKEAPR